MAINANNNPVIFSLEADYSSVSGKSSVMRKFLDYVWPIHRHELSKFLLITLLMFCILGIQNLIRAQKDSIINTMIGTETTVFLKFWGVLPSSFLITVVYIKLINCMKSENIFYLIISVFLTFFALFAYYIFPNYQLLHLDVELANRMVVSYPNFKWFILLLSNWSFSLFYIIAELWPGAVFSLLFWQFVNKITTVEESKRFYLLFGLLGQTGLYLSGDFLENLPNLYEYFVQNFALQIQSDEFSVKITLTIVLVLGLICLAAFWMLNNKVLLNKNIDQLKFQVKKQPLNVSQSLKMVCSSRYIVLITILLFCYGFAINLVEAPWKSAVSKIYKTPIEFSAFVGGYLKYTGVFTIIFIILGSNIVRRIGWFATAVVTPVMLFITGILFFLIKNFTNMQIFVSHYFVIMDPLLLAVMIGAVQNVLTKSSKYTLLDATKEMVYVPLNDELKTKGKAAADLIGTKLGKSAAALLQSLVLVLFPSMNYELLSPYLMIIFTIICILWIWAVKSLDIEYKNAIANSAG